MGFKLSSAIAIARGILNDTDADGYRYPDADLLEYGNGAIRALAEIKPDWLHAVVDLPCEAGKATQALPDTVHSLVEIRRIKNGAVVLPCDKEALDAFMPGWMLVDAGAAQNWMREPSDRRRYLIYPPAPTGQVLEALVVTAPSPYAADADTGLPVTITEAVADYIVAMAEARDDEHVVSGRSAQFVAQFAARLKQPSQE